MPAANSRSREDRLADEAMLPPDDLPLPVQPGFQRVQERRTVVAAAHVVLARPDELDRNVALVRTRERDEDLGAFDQVVGMRVRASSEAAAREQHVDLDLLGLDAERLGDRHLVAGLELLAVPHLDTVVAREPHDAVHRLHRRVRKVRELVGRLERLRRARDAPWRHRRRCVHRLPVVRRACGNARGCSALEALNAGCRPTGSSARRGPASPTRNSWRARRRRSGSRRR